MHSASVNNAREHTSQVFLRAESFVLPAALNDLYALDLRGRAWMSLSLPDDASAPSVRAYSGLAVIGDTLYTFGGQRGRLGQCQCHCFPCQRTCSAGMRSKSPVCPETCSVARGSALMSCFAEQETLAG
eukprot:2577455-Rhodomonas_salina.2